MSIDLEATHEVTLGRELEILDCYLDIQKMRFSDRLDVDMNIDDDTRRALVPTLLLQPLAENAIRHGIARSASAGKLTITAARLNGDLRIEMFNTGTLVFPLTRSQYQAGIIAKPPQLFSHADQVTQWQTSIPDQPPLTG